MSEFLRTTHERSSLTITITHAHVTLTKTKELLYNKSHWVGIESLPNRKSHKKSCIQMLLKKTHKFEVNWTSNVSGSLTHFEFLMGKKWSKSKNKILLESVFSEDFKNSNIILDEFIMNSIDILLSKNVYIF
jgi:hypothetical protein